MYMADGNEWEDREKYSHMYIAKRVRVNVVYRKYCMFAITLKATDSV